MGALPTSDPVAFRFAPYIKELREFFALSHLRYGSPEDIFPVTERLQNSKAFAEDMSSMIRSILLREGGSMAHAQLLEILAIAIGGPAMDHAPQDYRQPLRQLLSFLTGVLRRPWNLPPGEEAEPPAPASVVKYAAESNSLDRNPDRNPDHHPDHAAVVAFPSGPFATAAALAAAEQRSAEPARRQRDPVEAPAVQTAEPAPERIAATPVAPLPNASQTQPEYSETEFVEYEALESAPSGQAEAATAIEAALPAVPPADPEPVFEHEAHEAPAPPQFRSNSELIDQVFNPGSPAVEAEGLQQQNTSAPEPPFAETATATDAPAELAAAEAVAEPSFAQPQPAAGSVEPVDLIPPQPAAYSPVTEVAKGTQQYLPDLSPWHDSPFDDLDSFELVPEPPASHRAATAAPWIAQADDSPDSGPWSSSSQRNVLILMAAAVALAVGVAVALRPTTPAEEGSTVPGATTLSPATAPAPASAATLLTPQPAADPPAASAKLTPYGDAVAPQPASTSRSRRSSDEDADYTGTDVAKPTYRTFVAPPASSAAGQSEPQPAGSPQSSQTAAPATPSGYSSEQPATVERRSPSGSLVSTATPGHQSFRNPDATLAGDPRPVRPAPRSLNSEPTFKVSSGLMAANLISAPNPEYPALARLTHTQGEVILQAVISRDGHVSAAHVISGHHLLRGAAVDAVKRWRYRPYLADGHPVDVATIIRVDFRAHN